MLRHNISLSLAAATAMGISMAYAAPAQALDFGDGDKVDIGGDLIITNGGDNADGETNYDFDFINFFPADQEGRASNGTGGFSSSVDLIDIEDISLPNAGAFGGAPLNDFFSDILLADGSSASFDVETVTFSVNEGPDDTLFSFLFDGFLQAEDGQSIAALGSFTTEAATGSINDSGESVSVSYSGTLRVQGDVTPVPTPAAILPSLLGLGGLASKRKNK